MSPLVFVRRHAALTAWQDAQRAFDDAADAVGAALSRLGTMVAFVATACACNGPRWLVATFGATVLVSGVRLVATVVRFVRAAKADRAAAAAYEEVRKASARNERTLGGAA